MGRLQLHSDGVVRRVGNAMIIFREDLVAPLYIARMPAAGDRRLAIAAVSTWESGNPNKHRRELVGTARTRQVAVGDEVLFMPPSPDSDGWGGASTLRTSPSTRVQRRRVAKARDKSRRRQRQTKREHQGFA